MPTPRLPLHPLVSLLLGIFALCGVAFSARAYVLEGPSWPSNTTIVMHLELGPTPRALTDRFATWDDSAADALRLWNQYLNDGVQFQPVLHSTALIADHNGVNTVNYSSTVYGQAFGGDVLAVTVLNSDDETMAFTEADTLFNSIWKWDSYRGPLHRGPPPLNEYIFDFHRTAIHEFGHVLGLGHPDEHGQYGATAIMNSRISDIDVMQQDDIDGVRDIYRTVGRLLKTYALKADRLLDDPVRPRVYATLPADNAVAVIDTDTLAVLATLPTGPNPIDLAISADNAKLYVANNDQISQTVGVVDLNALTVLPSLSVPVRPGAIAAGANDRLYLFNAGYGSLRGVIQVDGTTGELQSTFGERVLFDISFFQINPSRDALYVTGRTPGAVSRFDVSTATGRLLDQRYYAVAGNRIAISHDGQLLCYSDLLDYASGTGMALVPANDLGRFLGAFQTGAVPRAVAFSPDDGLVYEAGNVGDDIRIFNTGTFAPVAAFGLATGYNRSAYQPPVTGLAVTGGAAGYLFVAGDGGALRVYRAASNPPRTVPAPPAVSVAGAAIERGGFLVSRAGGRLDTDVRVAYHVGGSAIGGGDYETLPGSVALPAGQTEALIPVTVLPGANRNHKVKVILDPAPDGSSYGIAKAQSKVFLSDLP